MAVRDQMRGQFRPRPRVKETVMKTIDIHRYRMLLRVREFGAVHRDLFPAVGAAGRLFAAVSNTVDQLSACMTTEASGQGAAREGAISKAAARQALWQALDAITRTARAIDTPGLAGKFHMPSARNDHELVTAARSFARHAAPLKAPFLAHGLRRTFLTDLQAVLEAFERATQDRLAARETSAAAKAGIEAALESALLALTRLDAIVLNMLRDRPTLLAEWNRARRVARVRASADRKPAPATSTVTSAPVDGPPADAKPASDTGHYA
jgi:hypothetical protein